MSNIPQVDCSICLDSIDIKEKQYLPCTHLYHIECINTWINTKGISAKCPVCNINIQKMNSLTDESISKFNSADDNNNINTVLGELFIDIAINILHRTFVNNT